MAEMYVQGVSTRKVRNILEKMCGLEVGSSQVSDAAKTLDDEIARFKERPLGRYGVLYVEAEESMTYFDFDESWWRRIRTSNCIERLNKEIKKRTRVVGVFPNEAACERLAGSLLMEQHEEWMEEKAYLTENIVA